MRFIWTWTVVGLLLLALIVGGQAATAQNSPLTFNGVNPRKLNFQPIDLSKSVARPDASKALFKMKTPKSPSLTKFLPSFSFLQNRGFAGAPSTPILSPKNNPYQPNPPQGINWFAPPPSKKKK